MAASICGKFVSKKISKIRWNPVPSDVIAHAEILAVGSWDNEVNTVTIWQFAENGNGKTGSESEPEPKQLFEIRHPGDVTDLKYVDHEILAVASSNGTVSIYRHDQNYSLNLMQIWERTHHFKDSIAAPCTAIDSNGDTVVSVGEDGRLVVYSIERERPTQTKDKADSCTMTGIVFLKQNEVITSNFQGQLKLWDLRETSNEPTRLLLLGGEPRSLTCIDRHPTQPSIVACGTEDGTLCIWDLRQEKYPLTPLSAHDSPMMEIKFHPLYPNHLFTCSMDGKIWHWDSTTLANSQSNLHLTAKAKGETPALSNPWLYCGASKHHLEISSLIPSSNKPINSLDIADDILACGSDNEALYIISNLKFV